MTVVKVNSKERFSETEIGPHHERFFASQEPADDPTIYKQIIFKCAKCGHEIEFNEKNFMKHSHSEYSNLNDEDKKSIDGYLKEESLVGYSFLDFYCSECKRPVSIFYKDGYGGKHGDYICSLDFVLEIELLKSLAT